MSNLPFLKPKVWPTKRKMSGISKYGFSEDDELIEQSLNELIHAVESKDHKQASMALKALIDCVMNKESEKSDAPDSQQEASSI
jgi:hypothetical protein